MTTILDLLGRLRRPPASSTGRLPVLADVCADCERTEADDTPTRPVVLATCTTCGGTYCTLSCFSRHREVA